MSNTGIIASAGSGKTYTLVSDAATASTSPALLTTYTVKNTEEITRRLSRDWPDVRHCTVSTWYGFILSQAIKPYQKIAFSPYYLQSINFDKTFQAPRSAAKRDWIRYFTDGHRNVLADRAADLAVQLNAASGGAVIARLERLYERIYIDECQDLAGYHLEFVDLLLESKVDLTLCGDPRQSTYLVSNELKNKAYRGASIGTWMEHRMASGLLHRRSLAVNRRSNQAICDFADSLYPAMVKSSGTEQPGHGGQVGIFVVAPTDLDAYVEAYDPQFLVWDKRDADKLAGRRCLNFGQSKGLEFDHVVIKLTGSMEKALAGEAHLPPQTRAKLYVAITRARHSVALIVSNPDQFNHLRLWVKMKTPCNP